MIEGRGSGTISLGSNGSVTATVARHIFVGSADTLDETVILTGSGDLTLALDGSGFDGIDRVITGRGDDDIWGNAALFNEFITGGGNDTVHCLADETRVDTGIGRNRIECGTGTDIIAFDTDTSDTPGHARTQVLDFTASVDKIRLDNGADIAAFLASGEDATVGTNTGVRFETASGDVLFLAGVALYLLSTDDFLA